MFEDLTLEFGDDLDTQTGEKDDLQVGEQPGEDNHDHEEQTISEHVVEVIGGYAFIYDVCQNKRVKQFQSAGDQHSEQSEQQQSFVLLYVWIKELEIIDYGLLFVGQLVPLMTVKERVWFLTCSPSDSLSLFDV